MIDSGKAENEEKGGHELSDVSKPLVSGSDHIEHSPNQQRNSRPQSVGYCPKKSVNFEDFDKECEEGLVHQKVRLIFHKEIRRPIRLAECVDWKAT